MGLFIRANPVSQCQRVSCAPALVPASHAIIRYDGAKRNQLLMSNPSPEGHARDAVFGPAHFPVPITLFVGRFSASVTIKAVGPDSLIPLAAGLRALRK